MASRYTENTDPRALYRWDWQTCKECLTACEEHGIHKCAMCHKHEGECDYGSCTETATHRLNFTWETRQACDDCLERLYPGAQRRPLDKYGPRVTKL